MNYNRYFSTIFNEENDNQANNEQNYDSRPSSHHFSEYTAYLIYSVRFSPE